MDDTMEAPSPMHHLNAVQCGVAIKNGEMAIPRMLMGTHNSA